VVAEEHHPRIGVQARVGQCVQQSAHGCVCHLDRTVEVGEVAVDLRDIRQVYRYLDVVERRRLVPLP
jgi:hypothetical protein